MTSLLLQIDCLQEVSRLSAVSLEVRFWEASKGGHHDPGLQKTRGLYCLDLLTCFLPVSDMFACNLCDILRHAQPWSFCWHCVHAPLSFSECLFRPNTCNTPGRCRHRKVSKFKATDSRVHIHFPLWHASLPFVSAIYSGSATI